MQHITPDYTKATNRGLHFLLELVDRYYVEAQEARQSINGNEIHAKDVKRMNDHMDELEAFVEFWVARKKLDLPHTNALYEMPDLQEPDLRKTQNLFWYEHLMAFWEMRENIRRSQSRNQAQGFHPDDVDRWKEYFQDRRDYFTDFVTKALPTDAPESTSNAALYMHDATDYSVGASGKLTENPAASGGTKS